MHILQAIHRYASSGEGKVKPLSASSRGCRLRVGNHRVLFDETEDAITVPASVIAATPTDDPARPRICVDSVLEITKPERKPAASESDDMT